VAANKDKIRATAQKLLQKGQIDKAIKEFQRLVAEDPKDVRTLLKIGDLQTRAGKHGEATETYSQVAEFYADQGFFLKAVAVYKQILKIDPTLVDVNLKLAELYHQLGLLSDATNQYRQISQIYEKQGRVDEAIEVLRKMVELDPENVASRIKLAEMYAKQKMVEEARNEFRSAASFLRSHHRIDNYIKVAERIVHFDPTDLETTRELANIYIQKNDARRALAKLQVCFKANPKDVETLSLLANAFRDLGQTQKTISVYRELAGIHEANGDREAYLAVMRKVLDVAPDDPEAQAALEDARSKPLSRVQPSQRTFNVREVDRRVPSEAADASEEEIDAAEVEVEVEEAEPLAGEAESVVRILTEVEVYIKYGLKKKALEHVQRIFELDPHHREARTKFKDLLLEMRDTAGATRELLLLANLAHAAGEPEQARNHLEELLGVDPENSQTIELLQQLGVPVPARPKPGTDEVIVSMQEDGVPSVVRHGTSAGPPLAYEPSPAAAEIDLDTDTDTDTDTDLVDLTDEPLQIEAEEAAPAVVSDESALQLPRSRPSDTAATRGAKVAPPTIPSQSGAPRLDEPPSAPVPPPLAKKTPVPEPPSSRAATPTSVLNQELDDLLASVPSRYPTPAPVSPPPMKDSPPRPAAGEISVTRPEPEVEEGEPGLIEVEPELEEVEATLVTEVDEPEPPPVPEIAAPEPTPVPEAAQPEPPPVPEIAAPEPTPVPEADQHEPPPLPEIAEPEPNLEDEVEEIRFFVQQGLEDEARDSLEALLLTYPSHPELLALEAQLSPAAVPPAEEAEPEPETLETLDLAAELDAQVEEADDDYQVSFANVFDEFKRGVAETVDEGDYDTHYNLGIAYKEMGLLEDAVREFDLARAAPKRAIGALTMKGICQLELNQTDLALASFLAGLNTEGVSPEEAMALRYEIGLAYESMGRFGEACKFFEKVLAMDPAFRDVGARLQAVQSRSGEESATVSDELDELLDETQAEKRTRQQNADKISYL
jgi:tetratricopeptide (TPR) repeat protein